MAIAEMKAKTTGRVRGNGGRRQPVKSSMAKRKTWNRISACVAETSEKGEEKAEFVASNTYKVPEEKDRTNFEHELNRRRQAMQSMDGFLACEVERASDDVYTVTQRWRSRSEYEQWMKSPERRRSHFGIGVWQLKTSTKHEVPEEFVPFVHDSLSS
jgi:heme-degrading monooxygenase HmoA